MYFGAMRTRPLGEGVASRGCGGENVLTWGVGMMGRMPADEWSMSTEFSSRIISQADAKEFASWELKEGAG